MKSTKVILAVSINPYNDHPARRYYHSTEDCPLLKDWEGQTVTRPADCREPCPCCSTSEQLERSSKAYRGWLNFRDLAFGLYMRSFLEGTKTEKELEQDMENM